MPSSFFLFLAKNFFHFGEAFPANKGNELYSEGLITSFS